MSLPAYILTHVPPHCHRLIVNVEVGVELMAFSVNVNVRRRVVSVSVFRFPILLQPREEERVLGPAGVAVSLSPPPPRIRGRPGKK